MYKRKADVKTKTKCASQIILRRCNKSSVILILVTGLDEYEWDIKIITRR